MLKSTRSLYLMGLCCGALVSLWGCGSKAAAGDADMRKAFSKKTFSIDDVPPSQRARVEGFMKGQQNGISAPPASKPAGQ